MALRRWAPVLALVMLAPLVAVPSASAASDAGAYLLGYPPGYKDAALKLVLTAGGSVNDVLDKVNTLAITLPPGAATVLARNPMASFLERDANVVASGSEWNGAQWNGAQWNGAEWNGAEWNGQPTPNGTDPAILNGWQWGLEAAKVPLAWAVEPGHRGAKLCVVDSGVQSSHPDLAPNLAGLAYNAIDGTSNANDDAGHGTHVASIAAAAHGDGWGIAGVSNTTILPVKVLSANGTGTASALTRGMNWCADHGADVVLLALTVEGGSNTVTRSIDYLASKNVVIVASAGNAGPCTDCVGFPAKDSRVIAVAASDSSGSLASFSSTGPQVAVRAPGVGILGDFVNTTFAYGSGTSQAAAFVAGAAALLREHNPGMSPASVRSALATSATGGNLDAAGALALAG